MVERYPLHGVLLALALQERVWGIGPGLHFWFLVIQHELAFVGNHGQHRMTSIFFIPVSICFFKASLPENAFDCSGPPVNEHTTNMVPLCWSSSYLSANIPVFLQCLCDFLRHQLLDVRFEV